MRSCKHLPITLKLAALSFGLGRPSQILVLVWKAATRHGQQHRMRMRYERTHTNSRSCMVEESGVRPRPCESADDGRAHPGIPTLPVSAIATRRSSLLVLGVAIVGRGVWIYC